MRTLQAILLNPILDKIAFTILTIVLVSIAMSFVKRWMTREVENAADRRRIRKSVSYAGFALMALIIAFIYSNNLAGLTVSLGLASAGIAFALQGVITNIVAWLLNSTGTYYKIGDRILLGGVTGDVIDINVMVTTMMEIGNWVKADLYNGRIVRVSNSSIFTAPVYNYSGDFPFLWDEITIPVKYGGDRKLAREILERVAKEVTLDFTAQAKVIWPKVEEKYAIQEAQVEPIVTLFANDNWLEYTVRYVTTYQKRRSVKDQLFTRIMDEFDLVSNRLGIASGTYDIVGLPALNVHLDGLTQAIPLVAHSEKQPARRPRKPGSAVETE